MADKKQTRLILAEKPSVAKDIAAAFSSVSRHDGYFTAGDTVITWGFGHLVELKEPHDYDPELKSWNIRTLPIVPKQFSYKPISKSKKQLDCIRKLIRETKPQEVILATDADREGELLGRLILQTCGYRGPVRRFWTSEALTADVVRKNLSALKPGTAYDALYQEALARQHADWLIGINETRALTLSTPQNRVLSVGRVQTAVLSVLAEREKQIRNFIPQPYWTLNGTFAAIPFSLIENDALADVPSIRQEDSPDTQDEDSTQTGTRQSHVIFRFSRKDDAEKVQKEITRTGSGTVTQAETKRLKEAPPQLFSLSDLQREANKLYGLSAADTLTVAQALYEVHKMLSYPRTACRYMATSNLDLVQKSLAMFGFPKIDPKKAGGSRVFNDKKVAEDGHHALIPLRDKSVTGKALSVREQQIFDLVKSRFIAAFMEPHTYDRTTVFLRCARYDLYASTQQTVSAGWRDYYPPKAQENTQRTKPASALGKLKTGDTLPLEGTEVREGKTAPPPRFTEATLLSMMQNAWRYVDDPKIRQALREAKGIGTEATRAGIIETLKARNYVILKGKTFLVTDLGLAVADAAKSAKLVVSDIGFTGLWEQKLAEIGEGKRRYEEFVEEIKELVSTEIQALKQSPAAIPTQGNGTTPTPGKEGKKSMSEEAIQCPLCGATMRVNRGGAFCSDETCNLKLWRTVAKKVLTDKQLQQLANKGAVHLKGLTSKSGKSFDAWLVIDREQKSTRFDFEEPQALKKAS